MTFFDDSFLSICLFSTIVFFNTVALQSIDFENSSQNVLLFFDKAWIFLICHKIYSKYHVYYICLFFYVLVSHYMSQVHTMKNKINLSLLWFWGRLGRQGNTDFFLQFLEYCFIFSLSKQSKN